MPYTSGSQQLEVSVPQTRILWNLSTIFSNPKIRSCDPAVEETLFYTMPQKDQDKSNGTKANLKMMVKLNLDHNYVQ